MHRWSLRRRQPVARRLPRRALHHHGRSRRSPPAPLRRAPALPHRPRPVRPLPCLPGKQPRSPPQLLRLARTGLSRKARRMRPFPPVMLPCHQPYLHLPDRLNRSIGMFIPPLKASPAGPPRAGPGSPLQPSCWAQRQYCWSSCCCAADGPQRPTLTTGSFPPRRPRRRQQSLSPLRRVFRHLLIHPRPRRSPCRSQQQRRRSICFRSWPNPSQTSRWHLPRRPAPPLCQQLWPNRWRWSCRHGG